MNGPDQNDWENDPVWNLVDGAKRDEAGPFFVRNVMREVRLSQESESSIRWWQHLLTPAPLLAGALGTIAVAILITVNLGDPHTVVETPDPASPVQELKLDQLVEEEMLREAALDPSAFTDEDLVALLY